MADIYQTGIAPRLRKMFDDPLYQTAVQAVATQRPDQAAIPQTGAVGAAWMKQDNADIQKAIEEARVKKARGIQLKEDEQRYGLASRELALNEKKQALANWVTAQEMALGRRAFDQGRSQHRISTALEGVGLATRGLGGYADWKSSEAARVTAAQEAAINADFYRRLGAYLDAQTVTANERGWR